MSELSGIFCVFSSSSESGILSAALVRGEVKNPIAGALAAKAIGMEVQLKKK